MKSLVGRSQDVFVMEARRRKRRRIILACLGGIAAAALILAVLVNQYLNHKYDSYRVEQEITVKNSNSMQYQSYAGGILKYSRDGVSAVSASGKDLWNGSYDMDHPAVDICGTSAVVADIGGKKIYAYTEKENGIEMTMDYKILQANISEQGVVAVMLEDTASNMINVYNPFANGDKLLVEIPTNVETGYPVAMDISSDGTSMVVSYVCVTTGVVESRATFYNFTDVGENTNCLVGAQEYQDRVISEVQYLNDSQVCLFHEKGYSIWSNFKKPTETAKQEVKKEILSAFCDENYVGLVLGNNGEEQCQMKVYNLKGKELMSREISAEYTHISMSGKEILVNTAAECSVYLVNGIQKWNCSLKSKILHFFPAEGMNCYFLVEDEKIEKIKLKNK